MGISRRDKSFLILSQIHRTSIHKKRREPKSLVQEKQHPRLDTWLMLQGSADICKHLERKFPISHLLNTEPGVRPNFPTKTMQFPPHPSQQPINRVKTQKTKHPCFVYHSPKKPKRSKHPNPKNASLQFQPLRCVARVGRCLDTMTQ